MRASSSEDHGIPFFRTSILSPKDSWEVDQPFPIVRELIKARTLVGNLSESIKQGLYSLSCCKGLVWKE